MGRTKKNIEMCVEPLTLQWYSSRCCECIRYTKAELPGTLETGKGSKTTIGFNKVSKRIKHTRFIGIKQLFQRHQTKHMLFRMFIRSHLCCPHSIFCKFFSGGMHLFFGAACWCYIFPLFVLYVGCWNLEQGICGYLRNILAGKPLHVVVLAAMAPMGSWWLLLACGLNI